MQRNTLAQPKPHHQIFGGLIGTRQPLPWILAIAGILNPLQPLVWWKRCIGRHPVPVDRQSPMSTRTNAGVITISPVNQIVARLSTGNSVVGNFIRRHTSGVTNILCYQIHIGCVVIIWQAAQLAFCKAIAKWRCRLRWSTDKATGDLLPSTEPRSILRASRRAFGIGGQCDAITNLSSVNLRMSDNRGLLRRHQRGHALVSQIKKLRHFIA